MLFKTVINVRKMEQEESIYQGIVLLPPVGKLLKVSFHLFELFKSLLNNLAIYKAVIWSVLN